MWQRIDYIRDGRSYTLGLNGIVNLFALPAACSFYEKLGFERTGTVDTNGLEQFEICSEKATEHLQTKGIIA